MANNMKNDANSDHCCNWDRPINKSSDVVVYREGEVRHCTDNPDWSHHSHLRCIPPEHCKDFREQRITQWLETSVPRLQGEGFVAYLRRCYAAADLELKHTKRVHMGDEYIHALDRFVFRLFIGSRSKQRVKGVSWGVDTEELVLQLMREECWELHHDGSLVLDPRLCRNPSVAQWPTNARMEGFEMTKIPSQLDTITRMDSR